MQKRAVIPPVPALVRAGYPARSTMGAASCRKYRLEAGTKMSTAAASAMSHAAAPRAGT